MAGQEDLKDNVYKLIDSTRKLIENKVELTLLKATGRAATILSIFIIFLVAGSLFMLLITFLFLAIANLLNQALGSIYAGYLVVAGFILLILILLFTVGKNYVKNTIINWVLKNVHDETI